MTDGNGGVSRRAFVRTAGGLTAAAAATGTASAQNESGSGSSGGTTHTVEMTDGLVFDPDSLTIAPGDTVEWPNVGHVGHSVTFYDDGIPEGATYFASGGFSSEEEARTGWSNGEGNVAGGESVSHTFETTGTYEYFCIPHENAGMVAEIEVVEGGGSSGGGDSGPSVPQVPDTAKTLGVATVFSMVATLGLAFFFLKYGGDYEEELDA